MDNLMQTRQKEFRTAGLIVFIDAIGLTLLRIIFNIIGDGISDTLADTLFTIGMQVLVMIVSVFLALKFSLRRSTLETLRFSNVRKPNLWVCLLCIPLGICILVATLGVSFIWQAILILLGYTHSPAAPMPSTFSLGLLFLQLLLTGVLPGICEEFANRGALITVFRNSFSKKVTVVLGGLAFGLFHQNITQIFYTSLFGMLTTYLVLETKSIFPGIILHFMNNSLSVYIDFATSYNLPFSGLFNWVGDMFLTAFPVIIALYLLVVGIGVALFIVIIKIQRKANKDKEHQELEPTNITVLDELGQPLEDDTPKKKMLYKPCLRDWAFYIGALVMTVLTNLATFVWGIL